MPRRRKTETDRALGRDGYDDMLATVAALLEEAQLTTARSVNTIMVAAYWGIGRRIVEHEKAGEELLVRLSKRPPGSFRAGLQPYEPQEFQEILRYVVVAAFLCARPDVV